MSAISSSNFNPDTQVLRLTKDRKSIAVEDKGIGTWIKANILDRNSYRSPEISNHVVSLLKDTNTTPQLRSGLTKILKKIKGKEINDFATQLQEKKLDAETIGQSLSNLLTPSNLPIVLDALGFTETQKNIITEKKRIFEIESELKISCTREKDTYDVTVDLEESHSFSRPVDIKTLAFLLYLAKTTK